MCTSLIQLKNYLLASCKSDKSIFKNINSKWIIRSDIDIDTQIKLAAIDEKRLGQIPRGDRNTFKKKMADCMLL